MKNQKIDKKDKELNELSVIEALTQCNGSLTATSNMLNISFQDLENIILNNKKIVKCLFVIQESKLDLAESKLLNSVNDGNINSTLFYLREKGKARGYNSENYENSDFFLPDKF